MKRNEIQMNRKYINEIADALYEKHVALMVGAGFSKNAEKIAITDKRFLNWNELSDVFYAALYGDSALPGKAYNSSLRLAQEVEIMFGRPKLEKILKDAVPDLEYAPSELYVKLMELPWKDVFTTNYDTLLERASDKVIGYKYHVVNCQEDLVNSKGETRIIKLHGSFPSHRPFIITEEDYRTYPERFAALVNTVQQALLENIFCMIGFSCEDPNFIHWVGWIHDNLGKSSAQKIYMISVTHTAEAKRRLLFERNIIVIDLEELWPEKNIEERLEAFLGQLGEVVDTKQKKDNWFELKKFSLNLDTTLVKKAEYMKVLNESYPGWVYLPWKMKENVRYVLDYFENMKGLEELSIAEQINYVYELVRFLDIAGRPILVQYAEKFWEILESNQGELLDVQLETKKQVIYLQLLRTYRELADWEQYDECHKRIQVKNLEYDQKQFLYACDCWKHLFRFEAKELGERLDAWKTANGDAYWPLIQANLYAFTGELMKAEGMLADALILVRRQQIREEKKEYLVSLEESIVSLLNFIRSGEWEKPQEKMEVPMRESVFSWWNENERYCYTLNAQEKPDSRGGEKENFDLSVTYTTHMGGENRKVFTALEYLRFLEQTGHPFRLQDVVNTKGLYRTIQYLEPYYPHWCLMQMLIARDDAHLDTMFGRKVLAGMSQEKVDNLAKEYLRILQIVKENVKSQNPFITKSVYEQAAALLPKIIYRFCYKCSESVLNEIFNCAVEICHSNERLCFKDMRKLFNGLFEAYAVSKQNDKLEILLQLPMGEDRINGYLDPICMLCEPKKKRVLHSEPYNRELFKIRQAIEGIDKDQVEAARNRLYVLDGLIVLNKEDRDYLCQVFEQSHNVRDKWYLYRLDSKKYKEKAMDIFEQTMKKMKSDSNEKTFIWNGYFYEPMLMVLKDMDIQKINASKSFGILQSMVAANIKWQRRNRTLQAGERVKQGYQIAVNLLLLKEKSKMAWKKKEQEEGIAFFEELRKGYQHPVALDMIEDAYFGVEKNSLKAFQTELWLCKKQELKLFILFYRELYRSHTKLDENAKIEEYSKAVFSICVYRTISKELYHNNAVWILCEVLLKSGITFQSELELLLASLRKCQEETIIEEKDSEQNAIAKLQCRIIGCRVAKALWERKVEDDVIDEWKKVGESKDEFAEVRNAWLM